jgi:hypothetical protein
MRCPGFPADTYAFYSLDLLEGDEHDELRQHLKAGCETCAAQMGRAREVWYSVALSTVRKEPHRRLRRKILDSVSRNAAWGILSWKPMPVMAAAGILVLAFATGVILDRVKFGVTPSLTFAPVYTAQIPPAKQESAPDPKPEIKPEVKPEILAKQVADPAQAA